MIVDPLSNLNPFSNIPEVKSAKWYSSYIRPLVMLICFIMFSYVSLWMGQHFVTNDKFGDYVKAQVDSDKSRDDNAEKRFEQTQIKLETIINQQTSYTEQLKAYSSVMIGIQNQVNKIDDRVIYLERSGREKGN